MSALKELKLKNLKSKCDENHRKVMDDFESHFQAYSELYPPFEDVDVSKLVVDMGLAIQYIANLQVVVSEQQKQICLLKKVLVQNGLGGRRIRNKKKRES